MVSPHKESSDLLAGRRARGEKLVDVLLGTRGQTAIVRVAQPAEEFQGLGDLLLG